LPKPTFRRIKKLLSVATWLTVVVALPSAAADVGNYKVDLERPAHLLELPQTIEMPTRVDIHVAGPTVDHDKSSVRELLRRPPVYSTTNELEILSMVRALRENDNKERVTNATKHKGYTYHLLLFQDSDHTVMHFRVLEFADIKTDWYNVWPRSDTGFGYFNKPIGPWLHSRVHLVATNSSSSSVTK
jgi:hypothetical protein